ncbi:alpha/beta hydrolase [Algoriphagus aestuariicola]|uniref:Alpha/beta hydrolase n=1 Tax=Algoriphagus aestuariicola TaxID=1852016 RepID=A0ABS3BX59_9BACT|nr:alpha/beta hydrolase [Algoriphagus aestuariicola]MBN7802896.1 alpha/beta hydrolase [Algoriphagus aestuariicola]
MKPAAFLSFFLLCFTSFAQQAIHTKDGMEIGGIQQYIEVDTKDDSKPILLFLHGGPGFSSRPYLEKVKKSLQEDFIIVQWDQRETGNTLAWNPSPVPLAPTLFHHDTEQVVDYLLERFGRKKLLLVGFSWGGFLGLEYAKNHPEKLLAYVHVSGMVAAELSEKLTLDEIRERAEEENNALAIQELADIQIPFRNWKDLYFQRKWTAYFSGVKVTPKTYPMHIFENWNKTWFQLFLEASKVDYLKHAPQLDCPVYFFVARKDLVSNAKVTGIYYEQLKAPTKELVWFDKSTHEIPSQEPKEFTFQLLKIPMPGSPNF